MRYLPLTPTDRGAMLSRIGVDAIDDLFIDVPETARLDGPINLPLHQSEMQVERDLFAMAAQNKRPLPCHFFVAQALINTMCLPVWIISSNGQSF